MAKLHLEEIVSKIKDVRPLPVAVGQIIELTEDPKATIQDLEEAILKDQVLTTKILRVANSAYYSYNRKISTISQAAVLIGFKAVKGIAFASALSRIMAPELKGYEMEAHSLWHQSQACAIVSREISKKIKYKNQEEAYIAGLLRDVGKTILSQYMETEYANVLALVLNEGISFNQAEERVLGFNHMEVGAQVAERWNLPKHLVDCIRYHHCPDDSPEENRTIVNIVHVADMITMMMGIGMGADGTYYMISEQALDMIGMTETMVQELISSVTDILQNDENFLVLM